MEIKKDTIEYNAESFATKPNAVAEDQLKKLPGVQVDASGNITAQGEKVSVAIVYGWKDFYKPVYMTFLDMKPEQLQAYEGKYKYRGPRDLPIQFRVESGHLLATQLWDGQESAFYPESDSTFFSMDWGISVKFAKATDGSISSVSAFDRDYFDKVKP